MKIKSMSYQNNIILKYSAILKKLMKAIIVIMAIFSKNEVIEDIYPFSSYFACFIMQLAYAFKNCGIEDVVVFIAVLYMFSYLDNKGICYKKIGYFIGFAYSVIYYLCLSFYLYNNIDLLKATPFQMFISVVRICGYTILFSGIVRIALDYMSKINYMYDDRISNKKTTWIKYAMVIFLCWLPWMIMDFPGSFNVDSIDQLKAFYGDIVWTSHHPPLVTIIMGVFVSIGKAINCTNFGVFLYIVFQGIIGAIIFSYSVVKAVEFGASNKFCTGALLFFAVVPMWGCYVQWFEKSLIYTEFITLFTVYLVDIVYKKECSGKQMLMLTFIGVLTSLLRKNGIYCIIPTLVATFLYLKGKNKIRLTIIFFTTIISVSFINNVVFRNMGIKSGSVAEALSLPFQQTARYVKEFKEYVTPEEKEVINNTLAYDYLEYLYDPVISDPVKNTYKTDTANLPDYIKVWVRMFFKHPNVYVYAYINGAYGYLAPVEANVGCNIDYGENEWLKALGIKHIFSEFPIKVFDMLEAGSVKIPLLKYFSMAGLYTWILILLIVYLVINRLFEKIIVMIPAIMTVLICTASPLANGFRYYQPVVACIPLLIAWTLSKNMESENNEC